METKMIQNKKITVIRKAETSRHLIQYPTNLALTVWILSVIILFKNYSVGANNSGGERTPIINTRYGQVQGIYRSLDNGDKVATYLGIPYATPPVNKNRLSPTRATQQWQRVFKAVNYGPSCPQNPPKRFAHLLRHQSEDCLHVNLFVPGKLHFYV